jgi:hypothetical protein
MSYLPELRGSLVRAADRQRATAPRRRRWPVTVGGVGTLIAAAVAIGVVVLAIVLVRHGSTGGHSVSAAHPAAQAPPPMPNPTSAQWTLISRARTATVARDPACSPFVNLPAVSKGSPPVALTSVLGVLRRPATASDATPPQYFLHGEPKEVYPGAVRLVRSTRTFALYFIPTANVNGWRPVPQRCFREEATALRRQVGTSARPRAALAAQHRYLAWQQYEARHPAGICLAEIDYDRRGRQLGGASLGCGWNVPEIEQGIAGLGGVDTPPGGNWFHGIVPDGVASVTLELAHGRGTRTARVVNNMFLTRLPRGTSFPIAATMIWRSASGAVIRSTSVP